MTENNELAAICGLFCGTCASYLEHSCGGCISENCSCDCFNGFKDCAVKHNVVRCYECREFPCESLKDFSTKHIVNGICHHKNVIKDLELMKKNGVDNWVAEQILEHSCSKCGNLIVWFDHTCKCNEK